jgi:uncharacterized protein
LRVGSEESRVTELVGVGPPVGNSNFSYLAKTDKPRIFILGEKDQYGSPAQLEELLATFPAATQRVTQSVIVPGADHFFVGQLNEVDSALTSWLVELHPELGAKK